MAQFIPRLKTSIQTSLCSVFIDFVGFLELTSIVNMIGQDDIRWVNGISPIRYDAIRSCLKQVADWAGQNHASVICPRFGSGLAGGRWDEIEKLVNEELISKDIEVSVYDLKNNS